MPFNKKSNLICLLTTFDHEQMRHKYGYYINSQKNVVTYVYIF